jgi:hypothetical protein
MLAGEERVQEEIDLNVRGTYDTGENMDFVAWLRARDYPKSADHLTHYLDS